MLSLMRVSAVRAAKPNATKLLFPQVQGRASFHARRVVVPFAVPHSHAFSTTRERELEAENAKLKKDIEALQKKVDKKGFVSMIKENGLPFVGWWITLYGGSFVGIYIALEQGLIGGGDAIQIVKSLGLGNYVDIDSINPTHGNIAVALLINELLESVRLPLCIATTPMIKRAFTSKKTTTE
ncbi:Aste57867_22199 [Aphanomyces stellatus]|uniref:Aste57867_22199 protein n=1 Tax=Aphanomyces stellatus TaxID=120398 RepID=A0A485LJU0_9STRA|nr:hypothetical protein As57867_022130 [Aphanomyces stellatus]VFT98866.1 Aste57867_22199 [Aphanomyces stellatus]